MDPQKENDIYHEADRIRDETGLGGHESIILACLDRGIEDNETIGDLIGRTPSRVATLRGRLRRKKRETSAMSSALETID